MNLPENRLYILRAALFFLFLFPFPFVYSQTPRLDSMAFAITKQKDDTNKVNALNALAFELRTDDPARTLTLAREAGELAAKIHFKTGLAKAARNQGLAYYFLGDYARSLTNFFAGLKLFEELGDKLATGSSLNNIGLVYSRQGNQDMALRYNLRALALGKEINDKKTIATSYNNIANVYYKKDIPDSALFYYRESLALNTQTKDKKSMAYALNNIGMIYDVKKNYEEAIRYYMQSLILKKETGDKRGIVSSTANIGIVYVNMKQYDKALGYLNQALRLTEELQSKEIFQELYQNLSKLYSQKGDYKKAFEYLSMYAELKDTLLNAETSKQTAQMQALYETDKKEKEIQLLNKDKELKEKDLGRQKTMKNIFISGFILIVMFTVLLGNRFRLIKKLNAKLDVQNIEIKKKNLQITDSIEYAQKIQEIILPLPTEIAQLLPGCFIFFRPKDVVSGDFYFISRHDSGKIISAVTDCTGHGVPGAFMSIIGHNMLQKSTTAASCPSHILDQMQKEIEYTLKHHVSANSVKDGMDIAVCAIDYQKMEVEYAGAKIPLYFIRDGKLTEYKADRVSISRQILGSEKPPPFTNNLIKVKKGDMLYMFSDGFADQKGGPANKKFYYPPFQELLQKISGLDTNSQKEELEKTMDQWKAGREQIDDILVMGIRI